MIPLQVLGFFVLLLPSTALTAGRPLFSCVLFVPIEPVFASDASGWYFVYEDLEDIAFFGRSTGRTSHFYLGAILGCQGLRSSSCGGYRIGNRPAVSILRPVSACFSPFLRGVSGPLGPVLGARV